MHQKHGRLLSHMIDLANFEPAKRMAGYLLTQRDAPPTGIQQYCVAYVPPNQVFDTFLELLGCLSDSVRMILHTGHNGNKAMAWATLPHDRVCLTSTLCDFQDVLVDDYYAGCIVIDRKQESRQVHLACTKLLFTYGDSDTLERFIDYFEEQHLLHLKHEPQQTPVFPGRPAPAPLFERFEELAQEIGASPPGGNLRRGW